MMNFKTLFIFPLLLLITNCKTQNSQAETSASNNNTIILNLQKEAKIPNSKIKITFENVVEESRCPVDVTCVWEGIAIINIKTSDENETKEFQVATRDFQAKNVSQSFSFSGYRFTLNELKPQPGGKEEPTSVSFKYEKEE